MCTSCFQQALDPGSLRHLGTDFYPDNQSLPLTSELEKSEPYQIAPVNFGLNQNIAINDSLGPDDLFSPTPADSSVNGFTITVSDSYSLLDASIKNSIYDNAEMVCRYVGQYVEWKGELDLEVRILPNSQNFYPNVDGLMPALGSISWTSDGWTNNTLNEAITGIDLEPNQPDIGAYLFVPEDGVPQNYGVPLWFDPAPSTDPTTTIPPSGYHDFFGILVHEVFHCLGFWGDTIEYDRFIEKRGDYVYFTGPKTMELYGGPLPLDPSSSDHYGDDRNPDTRFDSGLMNRGGNYESNRLDIGQIDLAVLEDLGHTIKTYDGLPLFETVGRSINELEISPDPLVSEGVHSLTVIANVLGSIMFLDGLTETVTASSHSIEYNGTTFDYEQVDGIITTVVRDGEFTSEFAAEIAESFPDSAGISYSTAVALIGQANMESTLMMVASAGGNYIG